MDLRKLRHMVVLAEELNFARAARKVHLTQSALSRSIQTLEEELGGRLFDRDLHGVALTAIGRQVEKRARKLLLDAGNLQYEVLQMQQYELGDVKLGAGPFPGATFLPPILAELMRDHPGLRVEVETNNWEYLVQHLEDEQIEFFIGEVRSIGDNRKIAIQKLARQYGGFFCRAGHPLLSAGLQHPGEVLAYPLASVRLPAAVRIELARYLELPSADDLALSLVCDNPNMLRYVALHSDGVLLSTYTAVSAELEAGTLVALEWPGQPALFAEMGVVTLAGRSLSPSAAWLVQRMQAYAEQLSEQFAPATKPGKKGWVLHKNNSAVE
ncbi:LysR family transcriptional regulator [Undibacterium terreum]|uniref:Transcriptional regulator n=1 Tax=Undibacterium terreum TaxID=1224302 RepID=A0A916UA24_9BURK|nr:LysR family transcriptional regulator [Undibacterium terreum]GGC63564.1 transcriptional regulator [Undibacterium terreum]